LDTTFKGRGGDGGRGGTQTDDEAKQAHEAQG
jgi:hypothetical protein